MAEVNLNALVEGLSGKVGKKVVMRQRGGRTMLSTQSGIAKAPTQNQLDQRARFKKATEYAKAALLVPANKAIYANAVKHDAFMTAFSAAVKDYLKDPVVEMVNTDLYKGGAGDSIFITMADNYKIKSVKVTLTSVNNVILESGLAMADQGDWMYMAQVNNPVVVGTKVTVVATDHPGKTATFTVVL